MSSPAVLSVLKLDDLYVVQFDLDSQHNNAISILVAHPPVAGDDFAVSLDQLGRILNQLIDQRGSRASGQTATGADPLAAHGRLLYNLVIPPAIRQTLARLPMGSPLVLATNQPELPWELLHDGQEYLCLQYRFARRMVASTLSRPAAEASYARWSALLIGNPTGDLPYASTEIE